MNLLFKDLFGAFKVFEGIYDRLRRIVVPPKAYSWQTLLYLSLFSLLMSSLSTGYIKDLIALCGWLFLIAGTAWYTTDSPLYVPGTNMPIGSLITGFLVSVFAFGQEKEMLTPRTIVFWPTISAIITAIPEFFEGTGTEAKTQIPKIEARQKIIVLLASCMVLSCWLQFCFVVDKWLNQYPSVQIDNVERSALVVKTGPAVKVLPKNGVVILKELEPLIDEQIAKRRWSEVEQWLLDARTGVDKLGKQVIETNLAAYDERFLWHVEPRISNVKSGYKLDLLSIWRGPSANPNGYYLKKSCRIDPVAVSTNTSTGTAKKPEDNTTTIAEIECDPISPKIYVGSPPPQ